MSSLRTRIIVAADSALVGAVTSAICDRVVIAPLADCGALTLQVLTDAENIHPGDAHQRTQVVHDYRPGPGIEAAPAPDT